MSFASVVLVVCGVVCLAISGVMLYYMLPREGHAPPRFLESMLGETGRALSQFILMVAGVSLLIKGLF